jgi:hypothetical protein
LAICSSSSSIGGGTVKPTCFIVGAVAIGLNQI